MKIDIVSVLQIIFVIAKIFGLINWSWWTVFLPLEIGCGLCILYGILEFLEEVFDENN